MNGHERAMELITQRDVEGITESDAAWLESHLDGCAECAGFAVAMGDAEQAVRSVTVMASAGLVASTQARVQVRAAQLREREARRFLIAISFAMGVVFSTASAWAWWEVGGWMVERFSLPSVIVGPGLVLFWLMPAIFLGVLVVASPESNFEGSVLHLLLKDRQKGCPMTPHNTTLREELSIVPKLIYVLIAVGFAAILGVFLYAIPHHATDAAAFRGVVAV